MLNQLPQSLSKPLLKALKGEVLNPPPVWLMRQAGRYLPEYRKLRKSVTSFLSLCYNPELASEITLQPIDRFQFDAAIIFSDILVVPHALGSEVTFIEGKGPVLNPIKTQRDLESLKPHASISEQLDPISNTIKFTRSGLNEETALIGFAGSPWTVATYMIAGKSEVGHHSSIRLLNEDRETFKKLLNLITSSTIEYLTLQVESGVDVLMLFDSWAGSLTGENYEKFVIEPNHCIVKRIRKKFPEIPIITFPRLSGSMYESFSKRVQPDCLAIDQCENIGELSNNIDEVNCVQGNLCPQILLQGGTNLVQETKNILRDMKSKSHIFNLGHGILPTTPIENVQTMLELIRDP